MRYDIVSLLSNILKEAGMSSIMLDDVDNLSTIVLKMKDDAADIYLSTVDDQVWIWSVLGDFDMTALNRVSSELIPFILSFEDESFYHGQPYLHSVGTELELRAEIQEQFLLSSDEFMKCLDAFFAVQQEYLSILR